MNLIELAEERQRVLGRTYNLYRCGICQELYLDESSFIGHWWRHVLDEGIVKCPAKIGLPLIPEYFAVEIVNAATKRNFYLDIAEELADIWVIANEAMKRMDIDPWIRSYLRRMQILADNRGDEALELAEKYGHDDIPVERVIPTTSRLLEEGKQTP